MNLIGGRKIFRIVALILFVPCLTGAVGGILMTLYNNATNRENIHDYQQEISQAQWMDSFSLPGLPIHDTSLPPFFVPKLRTHNWLSKLHLNKPPAEPGSAITMFTVASFDDVYVLKSQMRHHWIYISFLPSPDFDPWDKAFDELVQYHAHTPPAHNASLSFVSCISSPVLCNLWDTAPPALMLISPNPNECQSNPYVDLSRAFSQEEICLVEARIINLPISRSFGPKIFPSYLQQMLSLTQDSSHYSLFPIFDFIESQNNRWKAHLDLVIAKWIPLRMLFGISKMFEAAPSPFASMFDVVADFAFLFCQLLSGLIYLLIHYLVDQIVAIFHGPDESIASDPSVPSPGPNLIDSMIAGFMESLKKNMSEEDHSKVVDLFQSFTSNGTASAV